MKLHEYFENAKGIGVLATADAEGRVDAAIYARPHFLEDDDQHVAFIMADRLSHRNLQSNPHAAYLFVEEGDDYAGKRLHLTMLREETDPEKIRAIRRRNVRPECDGDEAEKRYLVHFQVDKVRPLVGED
jgi:hypothetical protein